MQHDIQDPLIGQTVAEHYRITERLGAGGMGSLYKATNLQLDQAVALKFVNRRLRADAKILQRLRREAQILGNLSHPNIVAVKSFHITDNAEAFLVLEYLEGETLTQFLQREGRLSADQFHTIFEQVCAGLSYAHSNGIIHRDLKPDNIMLLHGSSAQPEVKVLDFGLAKFGDGSGQKLTATGTLVGSLNYISPEQCAGGQLDQRADVYSLACVMHDTLTGEAPYDAASNMLIIRRHMEESLPPLPPEHSPALSSILQCCSAVVADQRLSSVDEMWSAIKKGAPVAVASPTKPRKPISTPVVISISAACIVLVIGAVLFIMQNVREQSRRQAIQQQAIDAQRIAAAHNQSLWEDAKLGIISGQTDKTYLSFPELKDSKSVSPPQAHELADLIYANYKKGKRDLLPYVLDWYVDCRMIESRAAQDRGRPDDAVKILKNAFTQLHALNAEYKIEAILSGELIPHHLAERLFYEAGLLTLSADEAESEKDTDTEHDRREEAYGTSRRLFEILANGERTDIPDLQPGQKQPPQSLIALSIACRDNLVQFWLRQKQKHKAAAIYQDWLDLMGKYHCGEPGQLKRAEQARAELLAKP
ncbi:MAG TPA: serine/threonine-protein kinase [Candidatus Obscuribacterales bacterium]